MFTNNSYFFLNFFLSFLCDKFFLGVGNVREFLFYFKCLVYSPFVAVGSQWFLNVLPNQAWAASTDYYNVVMVLPRISNACSFVKVYFRMQSMFPMTVKYTLALSYVLSILGRTMVVQVMYPR